MQHRIGGDAADVRLHPSLAGTQRDPDRGGLARGFRAVTLAGQETAPMPPDVRRQIARGVTAGGEPRRET